MTSALKRAAVGGIAAAALASASAGGLPQLGAAVPAALVGTCEELGARLGSLPDTTITASTTIAAGTLKVGGQDVAEHCRVTGYMFPRVSPVDQRPYQINFEIRMPKAWNGRFFHQGNGGIDGAVVQATGSFGGGPLTNALYQGFAVLSSDAGHVGSIGPAFGLDPQARLDYGYQAVGKLTPMAKQVIAVAYGKGPDRSYFGGCSNGGRHTLIAAARYAQDYDGYLAGAPGYNLPLAALANIFGAQKYATIATASPNTPPGLETAFTLTERKLVAHAVLARCDALDGAVDGLVQDTRTCQAQFNLQRDLPTCTGARDGTCLTQAQKQVVRAIMHGATTSNGERFYPGFPYDAGLGGVGIAFWEFTAPLFLDSGAVGVIFKVPPSVPALANGPAFALNLDIDQTLVELFATDATYTESGMSFMTPPDASDLSQVRERGGKVLVYHGVSDPIFSVEDTAKWYRQLKPRSGGDDDFARLYPVPGMGHCSGGPATDQADFISPLVAWVERGQAPHAIIASARGAGNPGGPNGDVPASWSPTRTRPLCPHPQVARYDGRGDLELASSWTCRTAQGQGLPDAQPGR